MTYFNNIDEFYPTPRTLLEKICEGVDWKHIQTVLEPSAGKGDIVDFVTEAADRYPHYNRYLDIDCIEKDSTLQNTLRGKELRVVHDDFLTYKTYKKYDLIIMNPPFSQGSAHLLKALDMQKDGGSILCILNAETIKNPYTNERKELVQKLEKLNAQIEYMENEFVSAERKTGVEIAVVKVTITEKERESFFYDSLVSNEYSDVDTTVTDLVEGDFFKAIVRRYRIEVEAGIKLINEYKALCPYILQDVKAEYNKPILELKTCNSSETSVNEYVKRVRAKYWRALFNNKKFSSKMTGKQVSDYMSEINKLENYEFSMYNILQIYNELSKKVVKGIEDTIIELFDELSHQYAYYDSSTNIHYYNGWKTNKAWIINDKVILPWYYATKHNYYTRKDDLDVANWENIGKIRDLEKTLNYLDGGRTIDFDCGYALQQAQEQGISRNIHLKYFDVTFYKKGTIHITFTNKELLKKLNIFGSQQKGWLPHEYGRKSYTEMDQEAKSVVDEFEGKEEYEKTLANAEYYIYNPQTDIARLEMAS